MKNLIIFLLLSLSIHLTTATSFDVDIGGSNSYQEWVAISGFPTGSYAGRVVRNIGDFNGDGIDDMLVNAANDLYADTAFVIYGQKDGFSQGSISIGSTYSEGSNLYRGGVFRSEFFNSFQQTIESLS